MAQKGAIFEFLLNQQRVATGALAGGYAHFYEVGGTTPKAIWLDRDKITAASNPYTLDANGTAQLYGDGLYRIVIKDSAGVTRYDRDNMQFTDVLTSGVELNANDYASLAAAVAAIGSTVATLVVSSSQTVTDNLTIPSTLSLRVLNTGGITIGSGKTLTINGASENISTAGAGNVVVNGALNGTPSFLHSGTTTGTSAREVSPHWFGAKGDGTTDDTAAINKAIVAAMSGAFVIKGVAGQEGGGVVNFKSASYKIGALTPIIAPITLNFNNSYIYPSTTAKLIEINLPRSYYGERPIIRDATVLYSTTHPSHLIYITYADTVLIENFNTWESIVTSNYIFNYAGSSLNIRNCTFQGGTAPAAISLAYVFGSTNPEIYSTTVLLDHIGIAGLTGQGVYSAGADISIQGKSVIQGCTLGGAQFDGQSNNITISDSYFEANTGFDLKFNNNDPAYPSRAAVRSCMFMADTPTTRIAVDAGVILTTQNNLFRTGGINGAAPPLSYVGINNNQFTTTTGYTAGYNAEIADAIRAASAKYTIINGNGIYGPMRAARDTLTAGVNSVGGVGTVTRGASEVTTLTLGKYGGLIMVDSSATGGSAIFHATYESATITKLSDPSSLWAVTDTGAGLAIYKGANSFNVNIKNRTAAPTDITVNVLGTISTVALP